MPQSGSEAWAAAETITVSRAWLDMSPSFTFSLLHRDRLGFSQVYSGSCANQGQDSRAWRFRRLQERIVEVASVLRLGPGAWSSITSALNSVTEPRSLEQETLSLGFRV